MYSYVHAVVHCMVPRIAREARRHVKFALARYLECAHAGAGDPPGVTVLDRWIKCVPHHPAPHAVFLIQKALWKLSTTSCQRTGDTKMTSQHHSAISSSRGQAGTPVLGRLFNHSRPCVPDEWPCCRRHSVAIGHELVLQRKTAMTGSLSCRRACATWIMHIK